MTSRRIVSLSGSLPKIVPERHKQSHPRYARRKASVGLVSVLTGRVDFLLDQNNRLLASTVTSPVAATGFIFCVIFFCGICVELERSKRKEKAPGTTKIQLQITCVEYSEAILEHLNYGSYC
jgi:hypothetical protein